MPLNPRPAALLAALAVVVALLPHPAMAELDGKAVVGKSDCFSCHNVMNSAAKKLGPSFEDVAKKYAKDDKAEEKLAKVIQKGGSGHWGSMPMPAHPQLSVPETQAAAKYVMSLKGKPGPAPKPKPKPSKK